jgi:hypothetical protein
MDNVEVHNCPYLANWLYEGEGMTEEDKGLFQPARDQVCIWRGKPHTTHYSSPLDAHELFGLFKNNYRTLLSEKAGSKSILAGNVDLSTMINCAIAAWEKVDRRRIIDSFRTTGFLVIKKSPELSF